MKMSTVKILTGDIVELNEDGEERIVEEGVEVEVDRDVLDAWGTTADLLKDLESSEEALPLPNITYSVLQKVIEYTRHHIDHPDDVEWTKEFLYVLKRDTSSLEEIQARNEELGHLVLTANYLNYKQLLTDVAKVMARSMCGKTPEELREEWKLSDDLTEEKKKEIKDANEWCLDL